MKVGISRWAVDNPTPVILLFALLTLAGIASYLGLPLSGMPKVELPIVEVRIEQPGATPAELETNIARRVEDALSGLAGLRHQTVEISEGSVALVAEFALDADLDRSTQDVREAVARVRPELPAGVSEPVITRVDLSGGVQLGYAVASDTLDTATLTRRVDDEVIPRLLSVEGVQQAVRRGGARREFRVELEPERLALYGIGADAVIRQLQSAEGNFPGGAGRDAAGERSLRLASMSASAAELGARPISIAHRSSIRLDEIARIHDVDSLPQGYALLDGSPVVVIEISKKRGASETRMAEGVAEALQTIEDAKRGLRFDLFNDGVAYTRENFASARDTLIEGAILTVFVVLLFLRSWRATLVAALAIPFSLLPTFVAMSVAGFSLNIITLLALILVIGILVDDAIVEVENIEKRIEAGEDPQEASRNGADAIGLAVIAITFTIVAVFLPVSFVKGVVGQYFREFGMTASIAVVASLLVARLLTPILCAKLLRPRSSTHAAATPRWVAAYTRMLDWTLRYRGRTAIVALAVLLGTVGLVTLIPTGFIPKAKPNAYLLRYEFAPGLDYAGAVKRADEIRRALSPLQDVAHVFTADAGGPANGQAVIVLKPRSQRLSAPHQIEAQIRKRLSALHGMRAQLLLGDQAQEMNLSFVSRDPAALKRFVQELRREAEALPGLLDVADGVPRPRPGYDLVVDRADAAELGVAPQSVSEMLSIATSGGLDSFLPRMTLGNEQIPIRTRIAGGDGIDVQRLLDLPVGTDNGVSVPLRSVASLVPRETEATIRRLDRERVVDLSANLDGLTLSEAIAAIEVLPAYTRMPSQVRMANYGETQYMNEMFVQFGLAVLLGLCAVYAVLVLLFRDWLQPVTIMSALPLSLGGAALALLLTGHSFNISTVIGLLMLFGIVGKNSILLVDYIVEARAAGTPRDLAVRQAGSERVRPIVMTTVAMVGGMLPAAVGFGQDDGFRAPMAIAVIGGLIASTLLSLLLVPMAYTLMDDIEDGLRRLRGGRTADTKPSGAKFATAINASTNAQASDGQGLQ